MKKPRPMKRKYMKTKKSLGQIDFDAYWHHLKSFDHQDETEKYSWTIVANAVASEVRKRDKLKPSELESILMSPKGKKK